MKYISKKQKRVLAIIAIILLLGLYLTTLISSFIDTELAGDLLKASFACTIIVPILLYSYILIYRILKRKDDHK